MCKFQNLFVVLYFLLFTFRLFAQQYSAVGGWQYHTAYSNVEHVTSIDNRIYAATEFSIFMLDKASKNIEFINKTNALSDIQISTIASDQKRDQLLIGYANGNFDLYRENQLVNFDDIKRNALSGGSKSVEKIRVIQDKAYLLTGIGVIVFDLLKEEFKGLYPIDVNENLTCQDLLLFQNKLYAATNKGLYFIDKTEVENNNQKIWDKVPMLSSSNCNLLEVFNNTLWVNRYVENQKDTIYVFDQTDWVIPQNLELFDENRSFNVKDQIMLIAHPYNASLHNTQNETFLSVYTYDDTPGGAFLHCNQAVFDSDGTVWIADQKWGLGNSDLQYFLPSSPSENKSFRLTKKGNEIYVAPGGVNYSISSRFFIAADVYTYQNFEWQSYRKNHPSGFDTISDVLKVLPDQFNANTAWAASAGHGLMKITDKKLEMVYDRFNSPLEGAFQTFVSSLDQDRDGNIWMTNNNAVKGLKVLTPNNEWYEFSHPALSNATIRDLMISRSGLIWMQIHGGSFLGLLVFDHNNTIDNTSDDQWRLLTSSVGQGNLPASRVYATTEDKEGNVWVGTSEGVAVFYNAQDVIASSFDAQIPVIQKNGFLNDVLEGQFVSCIAVDGANRKWLGTQGSGVFLLNEDASEEILLFNTQNSPILSDQIISIQVVENTGEVLISTDVGICSYRNTATEPQDNLESLFTFPNPVEPNYGGVISIQGLTQQAEIKIVDIAGNTVYRTTSNGGMAQWNGYFENGQKAMPGVYLVYAYGANARLRGMTKILIEG